MILSETTGLARRELGLVEHYEPGMAQETLERQKGIRGAIKMASNENPFGPSPKAMRAMKNAIPLVNRYPDSDGHLIREALARHWALSPEQILLGNGSDEIITLTIRAFLSQGQEIITARPTFLIYRIQTAVQGGIVTEIPMKHFRYDLDQMARAVGENTKLIFIANPDNPVGTYVTHAELSSFVNRIPERCVIFIDEAYYEFASSRRDYPKSVSFLSKPNIILSRTFSKAYGLSGIRLGYAISNPQIIRSLNKVREPFNVNALAQAGGIAALKDSVFLRRVLKATERGKLSLMRCLRKRRIRFIESATNFILIHFGSHAGSIYEFLLKNGVIVRWMNRWGLGEYIRVTIGTPGENRMFMRVLEKALTAAGGAR